MSLPTVESIAIGADFNPNLKDWLSDQANHYGLRYLLAHADDGVIWGRIDDGILLTSHEVAPDISPKLREVTLQQCHLFSEQGELLLWKADRGWQARLIRTTAETGLDSINEAHILWGDTVERLTNDFTLMIEGEQGLQHVVPIPVTAKDAKNHQLRLCVRHYIDYDKNSGEARLALSRLVTLTCQPDDCEETL